MPDPSPHAWLEPRLSALMAEAEAAGIARDVSVAVITDLVNGRLSAPLPPPSGENADRDIGEPDSAIHHGPASIPADAAANPISNALDHVGRRRW